MLCLTKMNEGCPRSYSAADKNDDPFEIEKTEDPFDF